MKCFSIDLDGTLLNSKHEISVENLEVLQDLHAQGHSIIFNTGRAYEDVIKYEAVQKIETPIMSINGTVIYSESRDVLYEASLPVSIYKELFPILTEIGLRIMVYTNQGGFPCRNPEIQDKSSEEKERIFKVTITIKFLKRRSLKSIKSWLCHVRTNSRKSIKPNKQSKENYNYPWLLLIPTMWNLHQLMQIKEPLYYVTNK